MRIAEACTRPVVTAGHDTTLTEAARRMRENHVGCVVVVDGARGTKPVGLVTDRDMVVEVIASDMDPRAVTVGDIMSVSLVTAHQDDDVLATLRLMRQRAVRRMPVIDDEADLVGVISLDDLLKVCGSALDDAVGAARGAQSLEAWRRP